MYSTRELEDNWTLEDFTDQCHRLLACLVFVTQSALLNYFLIYLSPNNYLWFLWIIADIAILSLMLYAFIITYVRKRTSDRTGMISRLLEPDYAGELPFAYGVWILYGGALVARVAILYKSYVTQLVVTNTFGPGMLQVTVGMSLGIFYFLVRSVSLRRVAEHPGWHSAERWLIAEDCLNILDAIDFIQPLFSATSRAKLFPGVENAMLAFACFTLLLPLVHLAVYSTAKYNATTNTNLARVVKSLHAISAVFLINIPLVVLRVVVWHTSQITVSAFLIKDILFIYVYIVQLISIIIDRQPPNPSSGRYGRSSIDYSKNPTTVNTIS